MSQTADLFEQVSRSKDQYSAKDIEVLEGLEPVRRRPGMYIGGTDDRALHHLAAEVLDNAMDEAVAGHASRIEVELEADGTLSVPDNGRGIPVDPHPKFKDKSALEVILTTLHSGGKFSGKAYATSGGLHGVGAVRGQRAVRGPGRRGRARQEALGPDLCPRQADLHAQIERRGQQPPRHDDTLPPRPGDLRRQGGVPPIPRLSDGALQGLSLSRGRDPLEMRHRR